MTLEILIIGEECSLKKSHTTCSALAKMTTCALLIQNDIFTNRILMKSWITSTYLSRLVVFSVTGSISLAGALC